MNAGISAHFSPTIKSERDTWLRFVHTHRANLRWLNRVMQNHEARASDLNRKLIFSFFFAIFLFKATET